MKHTPSTRLWPAVLLFVLCPSSLIAADQPQWGQRYTRNMVSDETALPDGFDPGRRNLETGGIDLDAGSNVKWVARLGQQAHGTPVVAEGRVLVGTNNNLPRDPRLQGDRGVMMCFDEKTGEFLWQLVVPRLIEIKYADWHYCGITSSAAVDRGKAYLVSNRCEVICVDLDGMADGNDGPFKDEGRHMVYSDEQPVEPGQQDADVLWIYDMVKELGVHPHNASTCSILIHDRFLYACTANGVEWTHARMANPHAPSLVVLDKTTGKLVARDDFGIGEDIFHGQWSSPSLGKIAEKTQVYFGAGNGYLYAFEPFDPADCDKTPGLLKNVWKLNGHPLAQTQDRVPIEHIQLSHSFEITAMPVFHKNRVYVSVIQEPFHNMMEGWLLCVDATRQGDVTRSGILWSYDEIDASISTVSIAGGLLYAAEFGGKLHCLDAETGRCHWVHDAGKPIWGSTLVADGKVYLGTGREVLWVLAAGKELKVLNRIRMHDPILSTPVAANGTLYVMTRRHLYAVGK